jgi:hypothetical protein
MIVSHYWVSIDSFHVLLLELESAKERVYASLGRALGNATCTSRTLRLVCLLRQDPSDHSLLQPVSDDIRSPERDYMYLPGGKEHWTGSS